MQKSKSLLTKVITICLSVICCVALALFAVSCGDNTEYKVEDGHLYLIVKGEKTDLGQVVGPKGDKGDQGEKGEQGEQGVPGNNGENGKDGNGIEGVEVNEEGKLVITYTNGETAVIEIPGKVCEHEFKEFELREANCQHDGLILKVCNDCGWAELEEVEGGHDFSLAPVGIGDERPANVVNLDYEADPENEDDWAHNVINGTFTATIRCLHCEEEAEVEFKFADIEIRVVEPTHIKEGLITELINYAVDEVEYNDQVVTMTTLDKIGEHIYNGNEINADRIYAPAELQEIFGDNYGKFVNYNEFECGEEGYAWFKCDECEKFVLLTVVEKHEFGEPTVTLVAGGQKVKVELICKNCEEPLIFEEIGERRDDLADCATEAYSYVDYAYEIYGETVTGRKDIFKGEKNNSVHRHGEILLDTTDIYRKAQLEAIFADDSSKLTILDNAMNCREGEGEVLGVASFKCDLCEKTLALKVRDDHKLALDENDEEYHVGADYVKLVFKCSVCGAGRKVVTADKVKVLRVSDEIEDINTVTFETEEVVEENCERGYKDVLVYSYNNEISRLQLGGAVGKNNNKHELSFAKEGEEPINIVLNVAETYSLADLRLVLGEDLAAAGINVLANEMNCKDAGTALFTCALCGKQLALKVRGDHDLKLYEENEDKLTFVSYDPATGECEVTGRLLVVCKVCDMEPQELHVDINVDYQDNNCTDKGHLIVTYTYIFDGEHTEELHSDEWDADANIHVYGDKKFDVHGQYTISLLKEIFGEDFTELANDRDCTHPGAAMVACSLCKKQFAVEVYGDHVYEGGVDFITTGDEEERDEVEVNWDFECAECHEPVEGSDIVLVKVIPATNKAEGKVYVEIVIELNGVEKTFSKTIRVLPAEPTLHKHVIKAGEHEGEVFEFYEDKPVDTHELDELGVEYRTFANDDFHVAIVCNYDENEEEHEGCGEILVIANVF